MEMIEELVKLAIQKINEYNEDHYYFREGDEENPPIIYKKFEYGGIETVVEDVSIVLSITATNNTLMLHDEVGITIISPSNYTYHGLC